LRIAARQVPSMWIVAPIGITIRLISFGTPIRSAASRFTGTVARLLPVPHAVSDGVRIFSQKVLNPFLPAARNA